MGRAAEGGDVPVDPFKCEMLGSELVDLGREGDTRLRILTRSWLAGVVTVSIEKQNDIGRKAEVVYES